MESIKLKILVIILSLCFISNISVKANEYSDYLKEHRTDLRKSINIPEEAKIIEFGALHGSAKTEEASLLIIQNLLKTHDSLIYIIETDYYTGLYYQRYIENGDSLLLIDLVKQYGMRIPQEKSINTFNMWKELRIISQPHQLEVIGIDPPVNSKYLLKYLIERLEATEWKYKTQTTSFLKNPETNYYIYSKNGTGELLKDLEKDIRINSMFYKQYLSEKELHFLTHTLHTINNNSYRDKRMYDNYVLLDSMYNFSNKIQFIRFGMFHLMKNSISGHETFTSLMIKNKNYDSNQVFVIMGLLTKSRVLWNVNFKDGKYIGHTTKGGFGISDCWRERIWKIGRLKPHNLSDMTMFYLNCRNSPYSKVHKNGQVELISLKLPLKFDKYYIPDYKRTIDYIDAAVLIENSDANEPIEALI